MDGIFGPLLVYLACVVGALGVGMALPRKGSNPQVIGGVIAAGGLGLLLLGLGVLAPDALPNINFYIFSAIALGSALRVISHPRPVYAALYFILTILASAGLYVLLRAEFMAFALVIVYGGAILITYLFVIMLATESPTEDEIDALAPYDRSAREPGFATVIGFVLLAGLTTMILQGTAQATPATEYRDADRLAMLPAKIEKELLRAREMDRTERIALSDDGIAEVDLEARTVVIEYGEGFSNQRVITLPADLKLANVEGVGISLLHDHPGAIEIAGVILLMSMLGAVILARKKMELDEQERVEVEHARLSDRAFDAGGKA